MTEPLEEAHLFIGGLVQGVGFRYSTQRQAHYLHICGFVRNRRDGRVEILAQGTTENLLAFIDWCHQGPPHAKVQEVSMERRKPKKLYESFVLAETV